MINYKNNHGVRLLNQREKLTLFGLFDYQLQEGVNEIKQMIGINSQKKR
jgi:hypothetical protein